MLLYPAYKKETTVHRYSGDIDSIAMSKFLHKKVDIKFDWRVKFFKGPKNPFGEGTVMMDVDASGNMI